jgi:hypothetical protein
MAPPAPDAAAERRQIATAVARLEQTIGPKTGTRGDLGGTFHGFGREGQMDCIDEATNTETYLRLLEAAGHLRHHRVVGTATRGFFVRGWPHTAAVIEERAGGARHVVDSWFHDNGVPPELVPLTDWEAGWRPSPAGAAPATAGPEGARAAPR